MQQKAEGNSCKLTATALIVASLSSVATLLLSNYLYSGIECKVPEPVATTRTPSVTPKRQNWDGSERMTIAEKKVVVLRLHSKDRCYIAPYDENESIGKPRKLEMVPEELSISVVEQIAGMDAVNFCEHQQTFLLRDPSKNTGSNRRKRQSYRGDSENVEGGQEGGLKALLPDAQDIPIEQRSPNCMDLLLDCGKQIAEVSGCYTWINGIMNMERECLSPTEFRVALTKPRGRIMKIQQEQWEICKQRRTQGLRC